ncbi:hypothetical protein [Methanothrix sp.]|uniref:hypothetical protein n=1 Tax=Methanothrix sp. TaxID=90426 RepID=UPI0034E26182
MLDDGIEEKMQVGGVHIAIDKHAGQIRYDFDYRLSESARRVKAEVKKRMLSSIESMESAYMAGLKLRNEANQSRDARLSRLREMEEKTHTHIGESGVVGRCLSLREAR